MTTTVSQEAREAAASILPSIYGALYSPAMGERCVRGILDEGFLIQAFHKFEQSIRQQAKRAFEERERKLREALDPFARVARIQGPWSAEWPNDKPNIEFIPSAWPDWGDFKRAAQALKETPDAG